MIHPLCYTTCHSSRVLATCTGEYMRNCQHILDNITSALVKQELINFWIYVTAQFRLSEPHVLTVKKKNVPRLLNEFDVAKWIRCVFHDKHVAVVIYFCEVVTQQIQCTSLWGSFFSTLTKTKFKGKMKLWNARILREQDRWV